MPSDIIPAMKIGTFLENYPELEDVLIALSPQFKKLKNPVLRRTVAKIVTLRQAAITGNIPVETMVNSLREKAGQPPLQLDVTTDQYAGPIPNWMERGFPIHQLNVTNAINSGQTPLKEVIDAAEALEKHSILKLITPILPSPIIDKLRTRGFQSWTKESNGLYSTYLFKK